MKEIKDLHLKSDAILFLFEEILNTSPYHHFSTFKDEILEKSKNLEEFSEINEELCYLLFDLCIEFLYKDVLSKAKYEQLKELILDFILEERDEMETERGMRIETLYAKHWNAMHNYNEILIDNLTNNIKINIK